MPGAMQPAGPRERDERETMNQLELAMEWRCGLPTTPRDPVTTLGARSLPGRWQRWRRTMENNGEAHRWEPSGRRGQREQPDARREFGERPPWMRRSDGTQNRGKKILAHPYLACKMSDIGFRQNP